MIKKGSLYNTKNKQSYKRASLILLFAYPTEIMLVDQM